jgi:hypothetical protein
MRRTRVAFAAQRLARPESFAAHYPEVQTNDIPFAQDVLGDQFLLRGRDVLRLRAETGEVETVATGLIEFLERVVADPVGYLSLEPLQRFEGEGGRLEAGQLLSAYPPFCTKESAAGVSLRAIPVHERLGFLATFAAQIAAVANGQPIEVVVEP